MERCPNCGRQVDEGDQACNFCQEPLSKKQRTQESNQHQRGQQQSTTQAKAGNPGSQKSGQSSPQRGQTQNSQQQRNGPQGGYDQTPRTGNRSLIQGIQQPRPMQFIKGSAILGSIAGLIFAVMMVLIGKIGGFPLLPGATDAARSQYTETTPRIANSEAVFDTTLATVYETNLAYTSTQLAPFLALGLAIVVGVLIAIRLNEGQNVNLATAGVSMFVGGSLLVIISSLIIGFLGPTIPDILIQAQAEESGLSSLVDKNLTSPQYTNIIINGVFAGLGSGAVSTATVFTLNNFMPE